MLTTTLTDSSGAFSVEVTIPTAYTGTHTLVALGLGPDQTVLRALTLPITIAAVPVSPASPASAGLVVTGPALTATIGLALTLLAVGVGAVIAARRRRPRLTAGAAPVSQPARPTGPASSNGRSPTKRITRLGPGLGEDE